jgi:hypothetical protein
MNGLLSMECHSHSRLHGFFKQLRPVNYSQDAIDGKIFIKNWPVNPIS